MAPAVSGAWAALTCGWLVRSAGSEPHGVSRSGHRTSALDMRSIPGGLFGATRFAAGGTELVYQAGCSFLGLLWSVGRKRRQHASVGGEASRWGSRAKASPNRGIDRFLDGRRPRVKLQLVPRGGAMLQRRQPTGFVAMTFAVASGGPGGPSEVANRTPDTGTGCPDVKHHRSTIDAPLGRRHGLDRQGHT